MPGTLRAKSRPFDREEEEQDVRACLGQREMKVSLHRRDGGDGASTGNGATRS